MTGDIYTGVLANSLAQLPNAVRSAHPTNSFACIGPDASRLLRFHTPYSHSFRPIEELVNGSGKMLLLGCASTSPGFSTVHLAENHLGLSIDTYLSGLVRTRYQDPYGRSRTFYKRDIPGCSAMFGRLYDQYRRKGYLAEGKVAGAPSMLINARDAYTTDVEFLLEDRDALLCDRDSCMPCALAHGASPRRRAQFIATKSSEQIARMRAKIRAASDSR